MSERNMNCAADLILVRQFRNFVRGKPFFKNLFLLTKRVLFVCSQSVEGLPEEVTGLLRMAETVPPVAKAALMYGLFALGAVLLALAVGCLVRSSSRQETLNLEGTQHYVTQEKNGKSLESQINPAFVGGQ